MLILGKSGSGKSASMRFLEPSKTGIINADKQELIFPVEGYITVPSSDGSPDLSKSNYVETSKPSSVLRVLKEWEQREDIDTIVLDTITHLITAYYITEALGKEFGGYKELATSFWNIVDTIRDLNKNVIVFGHVNYEFNDMGDRVMEMRSHGKMIKQFEPPSYFNILLASEVIKQEGEVKWLFRTEPNDHVDIVKAPARFTENGIEKALDKYEDNDLNFILNKLRTFYNN